MSTEARSGEGWLGLIGGGEFSFGETLEVDRKWLELAPTGKIGFLPTASGSSDYGRHFTTYLKETFDRQVVVIPIYRERDARRAKNVERLEEVTAVYLGAGVAGHLLDVLSDSPAMHVIREKLKSGGVVVGIAAAAQAFGCVTRSISGTELLPGFDLLPSTVIDTNFDPAHDRRLRQLMGHPQVKNGLGIPSGSAVFVAGTGRREIHGPIFQLEDAEADLLMADPGAADTAG